VPRLTLLHLFASASPIRCRQLANHNVFGASVFQRHQLAPINEASRHRAQPIVFRAVLLAPVSSPCLLIKVIHTHSYTYLVQADGHQSTTTYLATKRSGTCFPADLHLPLQVSPILLPGSNGSLIPPATSPILSNGPVSAGLHRIASHHITRRAKVLRAAAIADHLLRT
jgi:hypothetical protein